MNTWKELILNNIEVTLHLDTKHHLWEIWIGSKWNPADIRSYRSPDLRFSKAKGACVVEFLERLKEVQRNAHNKDVSKVQ